VHALKAVLCSSFAMNESTAKQTKNGGEAELCE